MKRDLAGLGGVGKDGGGVDTAGGDGSETGPVTKKETNKQRPYQCQPHPGRQG